MILNVDFALQLSIYTSLKRFICLKWILKMSPQNYILSSTTYIASHSLWINASCLLEMELICLRAKKTFVKLTMVQNWLKNDKNLFKDIQYYTKTPNSFVSYQITSSGWRLNNPRTIRRILEPTISRKMQNQLLHFSINMKNSCWSNSLKFGLQRTMSMKFNNVRPIIESNWGIIKRRLRGRNEIKSLSTEAQ